jgi:hypothetical protein
MSTERFLRINTPNVVGEEFESEVVVVNLESGCYFSLMGSAKDIWNTLTQGSASPESIIAALENRLDCTGHDVATIVTPFIAEMVSLELLVTGELGTGGDHLVPERPEDGERPLFEAPRVETFTDLQDILLLDPIHDVDESGWPMASANDTPRQ